MSPEQLAFVFAAFTTFLGGIVAAGAAFIDARNKSHRVQVDVAMDTLRNGLDEVKKQSDYWKTQAQEEAARAKTEFARAEANYKKADDLRAQHLDEIQTLGEKHLTQIASLQTSLDALAQDVRTLRREKEDLTAVIIRLQAEVKDLQARLQTSSAEKAAAITELDKRVKAFEELQARFNQSEQMRANYQRQVDRLEGSLAEQRTNHDSEVQRMMLTLTQVQNELNGEKVKNASLLRQADEDRREKALLAARVKTLEDEREALKTQIAQLKPMEQELNELRTAMDALRQQITQKSEAKEGAGGNGGETALRGAVIGQTLTVERQV